MDRIEEVEELETREALRVELRDALVSCFRAGVAVEDVESLIKSAQRRAGEEEEEERGGTRIPASALRCAELRNIARRIERGEINAIIFAYHVEPIAGEPVTISFIDYERTRGLAACEECFYNLRDRFDESEGESVEEGE